MAKVNISDVEVLDNPATFFDKFKFKITFECFEPLDDDLEWKVVYVGSAYNSSLDQTLDSILVGPIPVGRHQFVFEVDPPDPAKIPTEDIVGVTVVLIQALYHEKEFIRIGYYVSNEYKSEELANEPPAKPLLDELRRTVLTTDPRVTRFPIDWGDGLLDGMPEPEVNEEEVMDEKDMVVSGEGTTSTEQEVGESTGDKSQVDADDDGDDSEEGSDDNEADLDEDPAAEIDLEAIDDEADAKEDLMSDEEEDDDEEDGDESPSEDDAAEGEEVEEILDELQEGAYENDRNVGFEPMDTDTSLSKSHMASSEPVVSSTKSPLKQL
ncbi:unnamed protein product [Rodentolepis nana]|uniref:Histone chaperone n=1 Tax=Rodentolepis nana TaxID=102285 RepID=A0A0R3TJQ2_RODNA|nr:unnamed protein product [Rodentolepis nana]